MVGLIPLGALTAATDVTMAESLEREGSWSQRAVDRRVENVAADVIADSPTVIAAAESAVSGAGDLVFFRQAGARSYLGNGDFAVAPSSGNAPIEGNWYNVTGTRAWLSVPDGPDGSTASVVRITGSGFVDQRITGAVVAQLAGRKMKIRVTARGLLAGGVAFAYARLLVVTNLGTALDVTPAEQWGTTWETHDFYVTVPAGATYIAVSFARGAAGSGQIEFGNMRLTVDGADIAEFVEKAASEYVAESGVITEPLGDARYVVLAERPDPMPREFLSYSKGGVIGTRGKIPVAIRFDDDQDTILSLGLVDAMQSRGLTGSIALCSTLGTNPWNSVVTYSDIRNWNRRGMEVWSHGTNHKSPYDANPDTWAANIRREVVTSKAQIEAQDIRCMGWAMPGVGFAPDGVTPGYKTFLLAPADWNTQVGRLLTATYGVVETDMTGYVRHLPADLRYGLGHYTVSDGVTLAASKAMLDGAIDGGWGLEFMCHAEQLGKTGRMTIAEFLELLDYVAAKRDEGLIEVVTPSSLPFCDPSATRRLDLIGNGTFARPVPSTTSGNGNWQNLDGSNRKIVSTADHNGTVKNVLQVGDTTMPFQTVIQCKGRGVAGQVFRLEAWVRGVDSATAARFTASDIDTPARMSMDENIPVTAEWQRIRRFFTIPPQTDRVSFGFGRAGNSGGAQWDDVHIYVA